MPNHDTTHGWLDLTDPATGGGHGVFIDWHEAGPAIIQVRFADPRLSGPAGDLTLVCSCDPGSNHYDPVMFDRLASTLRSQSRPAPPSTLATSALGADTTRSGRIAGFVPFVPTLRWPRGDAEWILAALVALVIVLAGYAGYRQVFPDYEATVKDWAEAIAAGDCRAAAEQNDKIDCDDADVYNAWVEARGLGLQLESVESREDRDNWVTVRFTNPSGELDSMVVEVRDGVVLDGPGDVLEAFPRNYR